MNIQTSLYTAIRAYHEAAQKITSGWGLLAASLASLPAAEAEGQLIEAEASFLKNNKGASLSSTYRSNKSVALKALRLGVALDVDGVAVGKTAVEKACKAKQAEIDAQEMEAINASPLESGQMVEAYAGEFLTRFTTLVIAARAAGFDTALLYADAVARAEALDS